MIRLLPLLLATAASLLFAASASAGAHVDVADDTLRFRGDDIEPSNVTVNLVGRTLRLDEQGSRMTAGPGCTVANDGYRVRCDASGVRRLDIATGNAGSDVRVRAPLPATIQGGDGDDLLIGGPGDDVIDGGGGDDIIGGGGGADQLSGGAGTNLLTYVDRIAPNGNLLPRKQGVTVRPGVEGGSGARGEGDTIADDFAQIEGGDGNDRFELRDGKRQSVACNRGRDTVIADPLDDGAIDCERLIVAPLRGGTMRVPELTFPFPDRGLSARSTVAVRPRVPLHGNAIVVRIRCEQPIGLLAADGPNCAGTLRISRGSVTMAQRRLNLARGKTATWRVPLSSSRALARRPSGLPVTVTALPSRGANVRRDLRFTVRG